MTTSLVYGLCAVALFCVGLHGAIVCRHLVRKVMAINIAASGAFMMLIAFAGGATGRAADPVPQAMVLTGIVVAFAATAFALALATRINRSIGAAALDRGEPPPQP